MPRAVVITGPSGVGKGTLIRSLLERMPEIQLSISATTRRPRAGETQDVDYHFMAPAEFERHVLAGDFVEHADYAGARYGTLRSELDTRSAGGAPVVLEIEVQGARQVREQMPEAVQVFIAPPSVDALRARLVGRGTDPPEQVEARLRTAEQELAAQDEFAHVVVNDRLEDAVEALVQIVRATTAGGSRRVVEPPARERRACAHRVWVAALNVPTCGRSAGRHRAGGSGRSTRARRSKRVRSNTLTPSMPPFWIRRTPQSPPAPRPGTVCADASRLQRRARPPAPALATLRA